MNDIFQRILVIVRHLGDRTLHKLQDDLAVADICGELRHADLAILRHDLVQATSIVIVVRDLVGLSDDAGALLAQTNLSLVICRCSAESICDRVGSGGMVSMNSSRYFTRI